MRIIAKRTLLEMAQAHAGMGGDIEEYLVLVRAFPLVHIGDNAHLDAALAVFGPLFDKRARTPAEDAYLGALTDLIETYEDATVAFPARSGLDSLRSLVEENGLRQVDLLDIFPTQSVASEVLSGKRELTTEYIEKLARRFHVAPATFLDSTPPD